MEFADMVEAQSWVEKDLGELSIESDCRCCSAWKLRRTETCPDSDTAWHGVEDEREARVLDSDVPHLAAWIRSSETCTCCSSWAQVVMIDWIT